MRSRHVIAAALGCLAFADYAWSEDGQNGTASFDTILELPFVDSLKLAPDGKELLVATEGLLLHWKLNPLKLVDHQAIDILPNEMAFDRSGVLYAVGAALNVSALSRTISKAASFTPTVEDGSARYKITDVNSNLGMSQYSTIGFQSQGKPIVASSSSFTANPFPTVGDFAEGEAQVYPQVKFVCGGTAQLTIFDIGGEDYYLSSTAGDAVMEFGKLTLNNSGSSEAECFQVNRPSKGQATKPTYDAIRHAVIDIDDKIFATSNARKAVVALDPNSNTLHIFRIEPYGDGHFLSRSGSLEIQMDKFLPQNDRGAVITELATDGRAREIYVASKAAAVVLRFEFDGFKLRSRGHFAMAAEVRGLDMSSDGSSAAIVIGSQAFGGDWRIVLIANPAALADRAQIPASIPSVLNLQLLLNENGLAAGAADGILGPNTEIAVKSFLGRDESGPAVLDTNEIQDAVFTTFPKYLIDDIATSKTD